MGGAKKKSSIPQYAKKELLKDIKEFNLSKDELMNRIFFELQNKYEKGEFSKLGETIAFNLKSINLKILNELLLKSNQETEASIIRDIICTYLNYPQYRRERIVCAQEYKELTRAIKNNKKVMIEINNHARKISPYFIQKNNEDEYNYIFCFCEKNNEYRAYRLSSVRQNKIAVLDEISNEMDKEYIKNIYSNFDPFLSYGKKVKVRFYGEWNEIYSKALHNRPKLMEEDNGIYTFECSEKKGEIYFSQFFDRVEIIEPITLRNFFINKYKSAINKYDLF